MKTLEYVKEIEKLVLSGKATEHSYRPALQHYLEALLPDIQAVNEPSRQACGAPDYVVSKKRKGEAIDVGYIEAKDVNVGLDKVEKSDQMKRYLASLDNLILTDYLEFRFYSNQVKVATIRVAETESLSSAKPGLKPLPEKFAQLESLLGNFVEYTGQTIKSAQTLAKMMARKAQLMRDVFQKTLSQPEHSSLHDQLKAFKQVLIHDMDEAQFADVYAQTIAYGLFTARLHDHSLQDFSRQEARELIPRSNPFLRRLFDYVCGADLDPRVVWIVDALCEVYRAANVHDILHDFGKSTGRNDPIVHFYETFLGEYDSSLRKARGVWYTPEPVVNFIVRAVDEVLQTHFGLVDGLADTSKVTIEVEGQTVTKRGKYSKRDKIKQQVHRVQLLDVAAGTGTFTAEAIKQIYSRFEGQQGMWSQYVEEHLLPRLHGFEILMASYAICHLKIDLLLSELGYKPRNEFHPPRLGVYLTNALEEHHPETGSLFAGWLAQEANEANRIKRDAPIMVAYGNPPYSVSSQNKGEWIQNLIMVYKKGLNEQNINSLSDDYVKFIRYAEHYIEKTGYGVIAMISNNSFFDGVTHRQMRKHLLETFDYIYIYDLHGSTKKKETSPDGSPDKNVFDILQGVGVFIMVKSHNSKNSLATVYHYDSYGERNKKYEHLWENSLKTIEFKRLECKAPYFFFAPKNFDSEEIYKTGFRLDNIFSICGSGIKFRKDNLLVKNNFSEADVRSMVNDILSLPTQELLEKYQIKETEDWKHTEQKKLFQVPEPNEIQSVMYRPFEKRFCYYPIKRINNIIPRGDSRKNLMSNLYNKENHLLLFCRQLSIEKYGHIFICNEFTDLNSVSINSKEQTYCAPLYLYPNPDKPKEIFDTDTRRKPNLNDAIVTEIATKMDIPFISDHEEKGAENLSCFSPLDLVDYIYAVLHSPRYRETYKEFLKIDFPRIPYPTDADNFWQLVALGGEMRRFHLLEHPALAKLVTTFPESGDCVVEKPEYKNGRVYINTNQYFDQVPEVAWSFYIGGYQPAQKWLKDRKGRALSFDDIRHWQKVIVALMNTDRLMKEIDNVINF